MKITTKGSFDKTLNFLDSLTNRGLDKILETYGEKGCQALEAATPKRTGLTSRSWTYKIRHSGSKTYLEWHNTNIQNGACVAVLIQYGFVTTRGYHVEGRDYINPAMAPIYEELKIALKGEK